MKVDVLNAEGQKTGREVNLPAAIFEVASNDHLLWLAAKHHLANQRQGTHKSRERSEITGSRRKIKRQKGTGTARFGDIKNPIFRGGGRVFGPKPRVYNTKMNKKEITMARKVALSEKLRANSIIVVEDMEMDAPSTKAYSMVLNNLGVAGKKSLLVLPDNNRNVYLSSRNIPKASIRMANMIGTYDILNSDSLLITENAVKKIEESFA